jgi:hypothetical protein
LHVAGGNGVALELPNTEALRQRALESP